MNHRPVILCLTKIASLNRPKAFEPSDGSFDDPTAGRMGFFPGREFFLTNAANVGNIGVFFHRLLDPGVVVPLVQAQGLRLIGRRGRAARGYPLPRSGRSTGYHERWRRSG